MISPSGCNLVLIVETWGLGKAPLVIFDVSIGNVIPIFNVLPTIASKFVDEAGKQTTVRENFSTKSPKIQSV